MKKGKFIVCSKIDCNIKKYVPPRFLKNKAHFCNRKHYREALEFLRGEAVRLQTPKARANRAKTSVGKKLTEERRAKIKANGKYKDDNKQWKDDDASYQAKHMYVYRHKGKAKKCADCGATREERKIQWSNVDHKYSRNLDDYTERCVPCHRVFDSLHGTK